MRPRGDRRAERRLRFEGRLLARLSHPHLVKAYETVEGDRGPMVVLETLEGETLAHLVERRRTRLPAAELAWLGLHLCSALHYLHGHGLLHLDLKPSNVIGDNGRARVIDLSVARRPGRVPAGLGTAQYLPPEQARGGPVDTAADVWGAGAVLFAVATAAPPFPAPRARRPFAQLRRRAVPVRSLRRLRAALAEAIDACLEPEPAARPSVAELSHALEATA